MLINAINRCFVDSQLPRALFMTLSLSFLLSLSACTDSEKNAEQAGAQMPPAIVNIASPRMGPLVQSIDVVGSLRASQHAMISAERDAVVERVVAPDGAEVDAQQTLIYLDSSIAEAELKRAQAVVKLRQEEADRAKSLQKRNVNSQYEVDKALAELDTALANQEMAQVELSKRRVVAPFSGKLGIRQVNQGSFVREGDALYEIVNLNPLYVDFKIPETVISKVHEGQLLDIAVPALADMQNLQAKVVAIAPSVDVQNRTIQILAEIDNRQGLLKPGFFSRIQLPLQRLENVLWLPESALFKNDDQDLVLLSDEGKARRVAVKVLSFQQAEVAIELEEDKSDGLKLDSQVVTAGHHKVPFDGMPIMTQAQMMQAMQAKTQAVEPPEAEKENIEAEPEANIQTPEQGALLSPADKEVEGDKNAKGEKQAALFRAWPSACTHCSSQNV